MTPPPPSILEIPPRVQADLRYARDYIARDNPEAARRFNLKALRLLRDNPELGTRLSWRTDGMRCLTVPQFRAYRVYYQYDPARNRLRVVRFLHAARDAAGLLPD